MIHKSFFLLFLYLSTAFSVELVKNGNFSDGLSSWQGGNAGDVIKDGADWRISIGAVIDAGSKMQSITQRVLLKDGDIDKLQSFSCDLGANIWSEAFVYLVAAGITLDFEDKYGNTLWRTSLLRHISGEEFANNNGKGHIIDSMQSGTDLNHYEVDLAKEIEMSMCVTDTIESILISILYKIQYNSSGDLYACGSR